MHCNCMIRPTRSVGIRLCLKGLEPASRCAIGAFKGSIMALLSNLASRFAGAEVPRNSQDGGMLDCKSMKSSDDFSDDLMNKCLFHIDIGMMFHWIPMDSRDISDFRCFEENSFEWQGHETSHRCSSSTGRLVPTFSWIWMERLPHPSCIRCCHGLMFSLGVPSQAFQ